MDKKLVGVDEYLKNNPKLIFRFITEDDLIPYFRETMTDEWFKETELYDEFVEITKNYKNWMNDNHGKKGKSKRNKADKKL